MRIVVVQPTLIMLLEGLYGKANVTSGRSEAPQNRTGKAPVPDLMFHGGSSRFQCPSIDEDGLDAAQVKLFRFGYCVRTIQAALPRAV